MNPAPIYTAVEKGKMSKSMRRCRDQDYSGLVLEMRELRALDPVLSISRFVFRGVELHGQYAELPSDRFKTVSSVPSKAILNLQT